MASVIVKNGRYVIDDPLYQWDLNKILEIRGLSLASVPEIHFTNMGMDRAIVRQSRMDAAGVITVDVPNSILQIAGKIIVHVVTYERGSRETLYTIEVPVKARKKPNDYRLENDDEVYSFNALENRIVNMEHVIEDHNESDEILAAKYEALDSNLTSKYNNLDSRLNDKYDRLDTDLTDRVVSFEIVKATAYNTVAEMVADASLVASIKCMTMGYYAPNDGGEAIYLIKEKASDFAETFFNISLSDTLYAELIVKNNTINVRQLGATPENDLHDYILQYVDKCETEGRFKLYIPNGKWQCTETEIFARKGFYIYGDKSFNMRGYSVGGTILTSKVDNQDYVLKIGNTDLSESTDQPTANFVIEDIVFSSAVYGENSVTSFNHVNTGALVLSGATLGFVNCIFQNIHGTALHINDSWEIYFGKTNFRYIGDLTSPVLRFGESVGNTSSGSNISAIEFETMMFESVAGDCILFEKGCKFDGNKIGHINLELSISDINMTGVVLTNTNPNDVGTHYMSVIKCHEAAGLIIGDIDIQMLNRRILTDAVGNRYVYKYVVDIPEDGYVQGAIGSIYANNLGKNAKLLRAVRPNLRTELHFLDALLWEETLAQVEEESLFDLTGFTTIKNMGSLHRKKEHNYETELSNALPFYKIACVSIANKTSPLYSDESSLTPLKVICALDEDATSRIIGKIYNDITSKMLVRVKAPIGACKLQVLSEQNGANWHTFIEFTGTGEWQYIEVDTTKCDNDSLVRFADPVSNYETYGETLKFDIIKFIPVSE